MIPIKFHKGWSLKFERVNKIFQDDFTQEYRLLQGWIDPSGPAASALEQGVAEEETRDETETAAARGEEKGAECSCSRGPFTSEARPNFLH